MGSVYIIENRTTRKVYVGQTWESVPIRWGRHKWKAVHGDTSCRHLYAAIRKYGIDDFDVRVVAVAAHQTLLDHLERQFIAALQAADRRYGYNLKQGGSAGRHTEETRQRMSRTHRLKPNRGTYQKGSIPWTKGRPRSAETRARISISKGGSGVTLTGAEKQAAYRRRRLRLNSL